ncbi:MAG: hypothetical protein ABW046_09690 [Actinoplanes sp.]
MPGRAQVLATVIALMGLGVGAAMLLGRDDPSPGATGDEPYYPSTAALEGQAGAIVRGVITRTVEDDSDGYPATVATVEVRSVAKGAPLPGQPLRVTYTTPGSGPETAGLQVRGEYVLLLEIDRPGSAYLVNTTQGWFRVAGAEAVAAPGNDVRLSSAVLRSLGLLG